MRFTSAERFVHNNFRRKVLREEFTFPSSHTYTVSMFDFSAFPVITTDRLKLRSFTEADVDALFDIRSDYEVTKFNSGPAYTDRAQAETMVARTLAGYADKKSVYWIITLHSSDVVIGQLGFNSWDHDSNAVEVGFDLKREFWRQGIMQEALRAIILFGMNEMNLNRFGAQVSAYNDASKQLLTKLRFQHEGTQRDQYFENGAYHDLDLFALLRRDCSADFLDAKCSFTYVASPV